MADAGEGNVSLQFLDRVSKYSLVQSSLTRLAAGYQKYGKESQLPFVSSTLALAEGGVESLRARAVPLLQAHQDKLKTLDSFAMHQLDVMERSADSLSQSKTRVESAVNSTKDAAFNRISTVRSKLTETTEAARAKYNETKQAAQMRCHDAYETVTKTTVSMTSKLEERLARVTEAAATMTETSLDYMMPSEDKPADEDQEQKQKQEQEQEGAEGAEGEPKPLGQHAARALHRVRAVSTKAQARVYERALTQLHNVQLRKEEAIAALRPYAVDLLSYARKLKGENEEEDGKPPSADGEVSLTRQAIDVAVVMGKRADATVRATAHSAYDTAVSLSQRADATVRSTASSVTQRSRDAVHAAIERLNALSAQARQLPTQTRERVQKLLSQVPTSFDSASSLAIDSLHAIQHRVEELFAVWRKRVPAWKKSANRNRNHTHAETEGDEKFVAHDGGEDEDEDEDEDDGAFGDMEEDDLEDDEEAYEAPRSPRSRVSFKVGGWSDHEDPGSP